MCVTVVDAILPTTSPAFEVSCDEEYLSAEQSQLGWRHITTLTRVVPVSIGPCRIYQHLFNLAYLLLLIFDVMFLFFYAPGCQQNMRYLLRSAYFGK